MLKWAHYSRKLDIGVLRPNMEIQPQAPKNGIFQKNSFFEMVSKFRFQRALNHPQTLSLSQVMQENVILAYYAQIWKFGHRLPKMEFFKKFPFFEKASRFRLQRTLNHPQILSLSQVMQENMLSKKLSLGLNFSTPSGGATSPSLKESMSKVVPVFIYTYSDQSF